MSGYDVIVVGSGHNGLVAAARLARRGLKTLVLERRTVVGGAAISEALLPGFIVPALAHTAQLAPQIVSELHLEEHGLSFIDPDPYIFAPVPGGPGLVLGRDVESAHTNIAAFSGKDARRYAEFRTAVRRVSAFVADVLASTPPDINDPSYGDLWMLAGLGRRLRALDRADAYRLLRWTPMPVGDFVAEWFESEPLRAVLAAPGIYGNALGPRSAGSTAVWLMRTAVADGIPRFVRGGPGALTGALAAAAKRAGADIRVDAEVTRINVNNGRVAGVTLSTGDDIAASAVVSNADPQRTLLGMVDPGELEPGLLARLRSFRNSGHVAKINLALSALPRFTGVPGDPGRTLSGLIHIGPDLDYLERAFDASKYGECSDRPVLEVSIPSLTDATLTPSGAHVMSIVAQFAPYRLRDAEWTHMGPLFADRVIDTLAEYAPNLKPLIMARQIITPAELESKYGLTGGHIFHGELTLDQAFTMRPLLGWARYRTPVRGLYLCGAGTHPGNGVTGLSGLNASREILKDLR